MSLFAPRPTRSRRGFTIIELIVGMVLLAVVVTIALNSLWSTKKKAYVTAMISDLDRLVVAQEVYHAETGGYFAEDPNKGRGATFARSVRHLDFEMSDGVRIRIRGRKSGWAARAEHEDLDADRFFCAVYIGNVNPIPPATDEGVIECAPRGRRREARTRSAIRSRDERPPPERGRRDRGLRRARAQLGR